uniref:Uncharacterized protein n=1 Tax=Clytia hemisphaerica TaxID=252671 RepID=A0A7M5VD28_9CNID
MAARIRNETWKDNEALKFKIEEYILQGLQRNEIISYLKRDFEEYSWTPRTLKRRMNHFNIERNDPSVSIEDVKEAVESEMRGPGSLLGYRAFHLKIRQEYGLKVKRDLVYAAMVDVDYESVKRRQPRRGEKKQKQEFQSCGPNWLF